MRINMEQGINLITIDERELPGVEFLIAHFHADFRGHSLFRELQLGCWNFKGELLPASLMMDAANDKLAAGQDGTWISWC
jgi:hypothetical protein